MELHITERPKDLIIALGVPTFGAVSIQWHMHMLQLHTPLNRVVRHIYQQGQEVGDARNAIVERALGFRGMLGECVSHVMFVDDDVLIPPDAVARLLAHKRPIIAGLYYAKTPAEQPLILGDRYEGVETNWTPGDVVECAGHGMGCTLIERRVFEALEPPWFKTTRDNTETPEGVGVHWFQSEDMYFLERARKAGFAPAVDTGLFCWHYSMAEGVGYPLGRWQAEVAQEAA